MKLAEEQLVILDPWKHPQAILALFTENFSKLLPYTAIESVIIDRVMRQLTHFSRATQTVYRNAELMGLVVWYNYLALDKLRPSHPMLSRLTTCLETVYNQLPNKISLEYFYVRGEVAQQCGKDNTLPKFLHSQCEELTIRLIDHEYRHEQSDQALQELIDHMTTGSLPFRVTLLRNPPINHCLSIQDNIFKNVYGLILRGSERCQNAAKYINMRLCDIESAIQFIAKIFPQHYAKGGHEAALIGYHLALLKALLQPTLLASKTEPDEKIQFMASFNYLYQFLCQHNLQMLMDQEFLGVAPYKCFLKFQFLAIFDIDALSCRKEFNYLLPDAKEFSDRFNSNADHLNNNVIMLRALDSMLSNFTLKNPCKNSLRDMLCTVIIIQNFQRRIYEVRKELSYDAFSWLIARVTGIMVSLIDHKENSTIYGVEANKEMIDRLLSFIKRFNDFRNCHSYVTQRDDAKIRATLVSMLDEKSVMLYCKLVDYWHGQWDNNEPLDFNQVKFITENLVLAVVTDSPKDKLELITNMENALRNVVILKQIEPNNSSKDQPSNCSIM